MNAWDSAAIAGTCFALAASIILFKIIMQWLNS
jgi:hypothetical protein